MTPEISIIEALHDPKLLGKERDIATHRRWDALWKAIYGLTMDSQERQLFDDVAGGRSPPCSPVKEAILVIGRRGNKTGEATRALAWSAVSTNWRTILSPGEIAIHALLAPTKEQAQVAQGRPPPG